MDNRTRLARKLTRNPAAILAADEVELLVNEARCALGTQFSSLLAGRSVLFEDLVRWGALKARCEQVRTERRIDIKVAAAQARIPRYRVVAIESGRLREVVPELAWRYFDFLGVRAWVKKWIRANMDLATRAGIAGDGDGHGSGGRKSNNSVNPTARAGHAACLRTRRARPIRGLR